jgi:hypothetical protein
VSAPRQAQLDPGVLFEVLRLGLPAPHATSQGQALVPWSTTSVTCGHSRAHSASHDRSLRGRPSQFARITSPVLLEGRA